METHSPDFEIMYIEMLESGLYQITAKCKECNEIVSEESKTGDWIRVYKAKSQEG